MVCGVGEDRGIAARVSERRGIGLRSRPSANAGQAPNAEALLAGSVALRVASHRDCTRRASRVGSCACRFGGAARGSKTSLMCGATRRYGDSRRARYATCVVEAVTRANAFDEESPPAPNG